MSRKYNTSKRRYASRRRKRGPGNRLVTAIAVLVAVIALIAEFPADQHDRQANVNRTVSSQSSQQTFDLDAVPAYSGSPYVVIHNNAPYFTSEEITTDPFEKYSDPDALNRCQVAFANICPEIMPNKPRGEIGSVKPTGWHTIKYPEVIKDRYLYNRCHLIGYALAGENANPRNLITGTRYLNVNGMLPFENAVSDYVKATGNHVLYRVTPEYEGSNLVASGVLMEAESVEDGGNAVKFCVYCYNVQPGIDIAYSTGDSKENGDYKISDGSYADCGFAGETPDTGTFSKE